MIPCKLGSKIPSNESVQKAHPFSDEQLDISGMMVNRCSMSLPADKVVSYYTGIEDCTSVAIADGINALSIKKYMTHSVIAIKDVISFYSLSTGYNPAIPSTDRGGDPTKVLWFLENKGYLPSRNMFYGFSGVIPTEKNNFYKLAKAIDTLGFSYVCLNLLECDGEIALNPDGIFTLSENQNNHWSWGGHVVSVVGYSGLSPKDKVFFVSWGKLREATWEWLMSRLVVAFGIVFRYFTFKDDDQFLSYIKQWNILSLS